MSDATLDNESNVSGTNAAASKRGAGYAVYDPVGQKVGSAEEVFVNWNEGRGTSGYGPTPSGGSPS